MSLQNKDNYEQDFKTVASLGKNSKINKIRVAFAKDVKLFLTPLVPFFCLFVLVLSYLQNIRRNCGSL